MFITGWVRTLRADLGENMKRGKHQTVKSLTVGETIFAVSSSFWTQKEIWFTIPFQPTDRISKRSDLSCEISSSMAHSLVLNSALQDPLVRGIPPAAQCGRVLEP